ncbi:MAG: calcium/sodium antiporter [Christensenellaceae bacterium]|jgi:cation:H+ antiporter|nr:calcium/sodium antiporter [Christensenellaceae bacterium]
MGPALAVLLFVFGLFAIIKGGDVLVRSALDLNRLTGINQVIIGATFVSIATTLPEVFVSIFAVARGNQGIAVGNAFGAMITNISLILGLTLAFTATTIRRREILTKSIFLLLTTMVVFLFSLNLLVSWYEGVTLLGVFVAFLLLNAHESKKHPEQLCEINPDYCAPGRSSWPKIILGFIAGQVMLCVGAFMLVENGEELANIFGISETVIGFTVIAVGTSLPELTTAIASIRRGSGGLAIGNVVGANVISCTLLFGICGIMGDVKGDSLPLSRQTVFVVIPVLFAMTLVAVLPVLFKHRAYRWQGIAALVLYGAFVTYLFCVQPL